MNYSQHVTALNDLIADRFEEYSLKNSGLPEAVALSAIGEALINSSAQQVGAGYTVSLCNV